jgi:hypothetical protein
LDKLTVVNGFAVDAGDGHKIARYEQVFDKSSGKFIKTWFLTDENNIILSSNWHTLSRIAIENGSVTWIDRKEGREVVLGDLDQEISLESDAKLENVHTKGRLDLRDVSVSGPGLPLRKGGIRLFAEHDVRLNLPGAVVEITALRFGVQDLDLELSGKATNILVALQLDLRLRSRAPIDLSKLLAEVPKEVSPELAKLSLSGNTELDLSVKGAVLPGAIPTVDGSIHLTNVSASVQGVPAKLEKLGLALHIRNTSTIEIDSTSWTRSFRSRCAVPPGPD